LYRNLSGFLAAVNAGLETLDPVWPYQVDYPNTGDEIQTPPSQQDIIEDLTRAEQIATLAAPTLDPLRKRFLNSCVVSLTPKQCSARLVPMLELGRSDFHVCGRACMMLGYYQFDSVC